MKTKQLLLIPLFVLASGSGLYAQEVVAEDEASNYTEEQFDDLENLGTGFGDWNRVVDGEDAAVLLQTAADNGENSAVIDTDGQSFALRSSEGDANDQRVDLGREFSAPLEDGQVFSFQLAWNWADPGLTGIALYNGSWEDDDEVMLLDFDAAGYFVNGDSVEAHATTEDWDGEDGEGGGWREGGVALDVSITRNGDNLEYAVTAITEESHVDFSGVLEGVNADRVNFFNDGRPNWGDPGEGSMFVNSFTITEGEATSVEDDAVASSFSLDQNYPNPFNPTTNISFTLESAQDIHLAVYDVLGREIRTLESGRLSAGAHTIQFDASGLNSGIYLYRLSANDRTLTKRMTLLK